MSSKQDQSLSSLSSVKSMQNPSVKPAKAASVNPLVGKLVSTKWFPGGPYVDGNIVEYDPAKDMHKVVYRANTPKEFCYWVDMKKILPNDIDWEELREGIHTVEEDSDDDNAEKVKTSTKKKTVSTQTRGTRIVQKKK